MAQEIKEKKQDKDVKTIKKADKPEEKLSVDQMFADLQPGIVIKVHQKIKEKNPKGEEKERIQVFEGMIIARKHGQGVNSTITVRKISNGVGVEKIFPLHLPTITKIEKVRKFKTRQSKIYYIRDYKKRLKEDKEFLKKK